MARSRITQPIDNHVRSILANNVYPLARADFDNGEAPPDLPLKRMLLVLKRSPEQESALRRLLDDQQDKASPSYHRWLTPAEFGNLFGPSDADLTLLTAWLKSQGFSDIQVSNGRTVIEFSGNAGMVKQAFGTSIHKFVVDGHEHWANTSDPSVPTAILPLVAGINSLHNFEKEPQSRFLGIYSEQDRSLTPSPDLTLGCGGYTCYALTPYDFATIYDLLPLWNAGTPINGTGQIIAIVGRTDINPTDATDFWTLFGLDGVHAPQPTLTITYNGINPGVNGDEAEADIDTQWSGAAAPGATINFVTSASTETTDGVDLSSLYIVDNNVAPVMSASYGLCEKGLGTGGVQFYGLLWQQAAAQGISVFVSSGDNGSAGCDWPGAPAQNGLAVNGLASTPYNAAVGGTDFDEYQKWSTYWNSTNDPVTHASAKGYIPETTWDDSCTNPLLHLLQGGSTNAETNCNNPNFAGFLDSVGGSGGKSSQWTKPTWQTGTPNDNARDLPDISLFSSDGFLGSFYVICQKSITGFCDLNNFAGYGGTSVASPAFAGIMAMVNQKWGVQGNPNFVLYKLPAKQANAFHDIPVGTTIAMPCLTGSPNCTTNTNGHTYGVLSGYATSSGYDLATGLGSVDAANMVNNWNKVTFTPSVTTLTLNSGNPVTVTHGAAVPVSIGVTPGSPVPTGDVALLVNPGTPGDPGLDGFTLANGSFKGTTTFLPGGSYSVIAHYAGNTTYGGSYSNAVAVTVNPENSAIHMPGLVTGVDTNGNPVYSTTVEYASPYLLRADVKNSQGTFCNPPPVGVVPCPSGEVAFTENGNPLDLGTYPLNSQGYAEDQAIQLSGGGHTLKAQYGGDASFNPSSTSVVVTVTPTTSRTENLFFWNPVAGYQLSISVYVNTSSRGAAPSGTVTFFANGTPMVGPVSYMPRDGTYGNAYLYASLTTTTTPFPVPGAYTITASYSGDSNYAASSAVAQTVNVKFPWPTTWMKSTAWTVPAGTSVTLTAVVEGWSPTVAPTGDITIITGNNGPLPGVISYSTVTNPDTGYLQLEGSITFTPAFSDYYRFTYAGDANYTRAEGSSGRLDVTGNDFTLDVPANANITVTPGTSNGINLFVGMQTGADPVAFSANACSGLPAESACWFGLNPVPYTFTTLISVSTTAPHHVAGNHSYAPWEEGFAFTLGCVFVLGGIRNRYRTFLVVVICVILIASLSCGGGGNNGGGGGGGGGGGHTDPGTPRGTYPITVTATSGPNTHTVTFTLIVQ